MRVLFLLMSLVVALLVPSYADAASKNKADTGVYLNEGTDHDIFIHKKEEPVELDGSPAASKKPPVNPAASQAHHEDKPHTAPGPQPADGQQDDEQLGFNLDAILDLMAGDGNGNVNFGAIGMELATNLANVIDMNEVGSMATTLGMMLSGIGAANEIQHQGNLAILVNQVLNAQQSDSEQAALLKLVTGANLGTDKQSVGDSSAIAEMLDPSQLQQLAGVVGSILGPDAGNSGLPGSGAAASTVSAKRGSSDSTNEPIASAIENIIGSNGAQSISDAVTDFVNGNDTADISSIAQAIGIRNFFRVEEKKVPKGCPSCFNCMYPGSVCAHNATCNQFTGRCNCPSGWTGEDCLQPACLSPVDEGKRPAAMNNHCHQDTECRPGWGGWNCNTCLSDSACDALIPTGEGGRCYNGSELITSVAGQCVVGNKGLSRYLPDGVTPKMTFACDRTSDSCSAQFWISGKEAFYCNLDQCNIGTWGMQSTASIDCQRMKCSCIPGRFLCGNYGLDISSVLNEVEGPVDIKCHEDGFSDCYIREFMVSKTLSAIIGDDAINMECSVGQCMHYSQLPDYQRATHETSKVSMLLGISTALFAVFLVLHLVKLLVRKHDLGDPGQAAIPPDSASSGQNEKTKSKDAAEIDSVLMDTKRVTVSFRDICYKIPTQGPDFVSLGTLGISSSPGEVDPSSNGSRTTMEVLKGISGIVQPGEILAILGASGAGKSTLLDILSRREKCGHVSGKVLINNRDLIGSITTEEFHRMSGYVDQQDLHVATATVYESVMTSALLRLPCSMSTAAKEARVHEVLTELGLWSIRDSKIGKSGARGISGGEMRRVSIACELVTSPSVIFLDEPTSGLDAYNAYAVMDTLSKLACRYGRTVICTIHQPRTDIFSMFNQLIVLAAGQMCYSGPAADISGYLDSIGHPVPDGYNVADFSVDLVQQATLAKSSSSSSSSSSQQMKDHSKSHKPGETMQQSSSGDEPVGSGSDSEWSPLLAPVRTTSAPNNTSKDQSAAKEHKGTATQFLIRDADISLQQILDSFEASSHFRGILNKLDRITGTGWTPTNFEMVSSTGITPYTRPVTPMQQVKVIFMNLYDLAHILYLRLRGRQINASFDDKLRPSVYEQFKIISARIFRHLYRDPTLMLANYALSLFIGLMCGILFYQLDNSVQGVQNRLGLLIFILAFYAFGCTTSLLVFAEERLLYLREHANAYYSPLSYFMAKVTFDLVPLRVVPPLLLTLVAYPMTGLAATWVQFIKFISILVLFHLNIASLMFFIGLLAEELVVSNFLASILLLFSLLFGGLILNKESIPPVLQSLCRLSPFNLAYEALAINELRHAHIEEVRFGLEIQIPTASLISSFGFDLLAFWPDVIILCITLAASLGLSLLWLTYVIKERR